MPLGERGPHERWGEKGEPLLKDVILLLLARLT